MFQSRTGPFRFVKHAAQSRMRFREACCLKTYRISECIPRYTFCKACCPKSNLTSVKHTTSYSTFTLNFIHNHPPRIPGDLHQKFAPTLGLLHPSFSQGVGIFWDSSRGAGICLYTIFFIFRISIIMARTGD